MSTAGRLRLGTRSDVWRAPDNDARERSGQQGADGLQVMCEGGGMANATIIERVDN